MDANFVTDGTLPVPRELAGPLPRRTRLSQNGAPLVVGAAILLSIAIACAFRALILAVPQMQKRTELRRGGSEISGTIQSFSDSFINYVFTVNGNSYEGRARLPEHILANGNLFEKYLNGSSIPVRYLPQNPSINHPAAWEWPALEDLGWFFALIVSGTFGILFVLFLRSDLQLVANGMPIAGVVTKCTSPGRGGFRTLYEFRAEDGRIAQGTCRTWTAQEIGARIWVLYLPQNPKRYQAYCSLGYAVVL